MISLPCTYLVNFIYYPFHCSAGGNRRQIPLHNFLHLLRACLGKFSP